MTKVIFTSVERTNIMCNIYGYCRVSTKKQSLERQIRNIRNAYPTAIIVTEQYTGTKISRPQFDKLICRLCPKDLLVVDSLSRFSRTAEEGFKLYEELFHKGIDIAFLKEPQIDTQVFKQARERAVPMTGTAVDLILEGVNKYLLELAKQQIIASFKVAESEVLSLKQRTKEGLLSARLRGVVLGARKGSHTERRISKTSKEIIRKHSKTFGGTLSDVECMKMCGVSKKTYYKYKKELLSGLPL